MIAKFAAPTEVSMALMSENLFTFSQQFETGWTRVNITSFASNTVIAPDGTLTADVVSNTPNAHSYVGKFTRILNNTTYTASVYVKPLTTNKIIAFEWGNPTPAFVNGTFNLSTLTSTGVGVRTITPLDDGWYRITQTFTTGSIGNPSFNVIAYVGAYGSTSDSVSFALWGAQLERGSVATEYTPTTSAAVIRPVMGASATATATISIVNGSLSTPINITNAGFGYMHQNPPRVIIETPKPSYENIIDITDVKGFSGIITGISTTAGVNGGSLAIKFNLDLTGVTNPEFLQNGYPIFVNDTLVGKGVTSVYTSNSSVVGLGTTFANNIYIVQQYTYNTGNNTGIITSNIDSRTNIVGLTTSGICGKFSWGRLSGFAGRTNPVSIGVTGRVVDVGLSTFPVVQRRNYGLRDTGAITKQ